MLWRKLNVIDVLNGSSYFTEIFILRQRILIVIRSLLVQSDLMQILLVTLRQLFVSN